MNPMFNQIFGERQKVTKERLNEIFKQQSISQKFKAITTHEIYKKICQEAIKKYRDIILEILKNDLMDGQEERIYRKYEESVKYIIVDKAMDICAQEGKLFEQSVIIAVDIFFERLNEITEEEMNNLIENMKIQLIKENYID